MSLKQHTKEKTCPYVLMSLKNHTFRLILFFGGVVFLLQSE